MDHDSIESKPSGRSAVWKRTWMGFRGSGVQIPASRPVKSMGYMNFVTLFLLGFNPGYDLGYKVDNSQENSTRLRRMPQVASSRVESYHIWPLKIVKRLTLKFKDGPHRNEARPWRRAGSWKPDTRQYQRCRCSLAVTGPAYRPFALSERPRANLFYVLAPNTTNGDTVVLPSARVKAILRFGWLSSNTWHIPSDPVGSKCSSFRRGFTHWLPHATP